MGGLSLLAGIGFTMSIFIGELAYSSQETYLLYAKTGVIVASTAGREFGLHLALYYREKERVKIFL